MRCRNCPKYTNMRKSWKTPPYSTNPYHQLLLTNYLNFLLILEWVVLIAPAFQYWQLLSIAHRRLQLLQFLAKANVTQFILSFESFERHPNSVWVCSRINFHHFLTHNNKQIPVKSISPQECGPIAVTSSVIDQVGDFLIWLAIPNKENSHIKFQNQSWGTKVIRGQREDSLLKWSHRPLPIVPIVFTIGLGMLNIFEHSPISSYHMSIWCPVLATNLSYATQI